jgi:hypothetical protein
MTIAPWMLDAVFVAVGAEFVVLALVLRRQGAQRWLPALFWFLASGALLMLAVRNALSGTSGLSIAGLLLASLVTHLACLLSAWRAIEKR